MTPRRNAKEDILRASLHLFARTGFGTTGMREIAIAVGIQPASISLEGGSPLPGR